MARAIDSEVAYQFFTEQLVKETGAFSKGVNKGLNIARSAMRNPDAIPTLTQPNEPLTLEELGEMSYTDWVWLEFPREKASDNCWERGWKAYRLYSHERYGVSWIAYRRPPEGEEET